MKLLETILFRTVPVWLCTLLLIITMLTGVATTLLVYNADATKSKFPKVYSVLFSTLDNLSVVIHTFSKVLSTGQLNNQVVKATFPVGFSTPNNEDLDGYFLVSAYDAQNKVSSIFLFDLNSKKLLREWVPDRSKLANLVNQLSFQSTSNEVQNFRSQHPIMTADGGVIIGSGEGVVLKLDEGSNIEWFIDRHFHHSIEPGLMEGQFISQIVVDKDVKLPSGKVLEPLRNDGYVIFSGDGKIIEERSFAQILLDNGYSGLLLGSKWEDDRIHLNDAEYIFETDEYVKKGDIMMSSRHLSVVLLYRPSENKVIWLKQGPFLNQHDVDYLGNGVFSIFGNDNLNSPLTPRAYADHSSIFTYDMKTDDVQIMLTLDKVPISINSQGRAKLLENSDIFIEDGTRAFILDAGGNIKLSYAHPVTDASAGAMHWTRYYSSIKVEK